MMNPEVKTKWVAALRSGKYTQTKRKLKQGGKHCCLGVLCEVSGIETGFGIDQNKLQTHTEGLSVTIQEWASLPSISGAKVQIDGITKMLDDHNDNGKTFLQIADAIEEQL